MVSRSRLSNRSSIPPITVYNLQQQALELFLLEYVNPDISGFKTKVQEQRTSGSERERIIILTSDWQDLSFRVGDRV